MFENRKNLNNSENFRTFKNVLKLSKLKKWGRAIAQAVSRWLPTAAARVQTRV
jgi:hypothetical protein